MEQRVVYGDWLSLPSLARVSKDDPRVLLNAVSDDIAVREFIEASEKMSEEAEGMLEDDDDGYAVVVAPLALRIDDIGMPYSSRADSLVEISVKGSAGAYFVMIPYQQFVEILAGERMHVSYS